MKITAILLGVLVLGGAYVAFRGALAGDEEVDVATATLTYPSEAGAVLTASGYVVAQQKAAVASKGTGRLVFLGVEEGDHVRKGQIIARLEDQDVVAAYDKAKADLQVALADSFDAQQSLARAQKLFGSNLIAKADLDAAQANYSRVVASIQSARAALDGAAVAVENTRIRAPFDGTVLTKDADVGEVVAPFAAATNSRGDVVTIADMSSLQVEADVSESNITRVSLGQPCEIVLDAYPDVRYQGTVHKIVPTADRTKATVMTKVAFKHLDIRVLPEMSAKVTFLSKAIAGASAGLPPQLSVPFSSVVERDGRAVVFLVCGHRAIETPIRTGDTLGSIVQVKEGLARGDTVVLSPSPDLESGTRVRIRPH